MKRVYLLLTVLFFLTISLMFTGFQCGSAEVTSGKLYEQRQDWVNAEKAYSKEVEKNPANAEAWYHLGDVRRQMNNIPGMLEAFNGSLKASNEFAEKIYTMKMFIWGNSLNQGVNLYNKSVNASKDSASMLRQKAIDAYKTAVAVNPDSAITYLNLSYAYRAEGDYDKEVAFIKEALKRKRDVKIAMSLIDAYIKKAEDAKAAGKTEDANIEFSNAIAATNDARAIDPENLDLLRELIDVYIEAGRAKEAIPLMEEALKQDPTNKIFHFNIGLLLMQSDRVEESITHYDAAIALDSTFEDGLWNGAIAYMKLGETMKKSSDSKLDSKKKDGENRAYLEKFKVAVKLTEKLVSLKPEEAKYWNGLGAAYANADMGKLAQKAFEKADALGKK